MKNIKFDYFFPEDFFKKHVNEPFNQFLIESCFGIEPDNNEVTYGDPNKKEPDLFIYGYPFELTLASKKTDTMNYIKNIKDHSFTTDNIEDISIDCLRNACLKKSKKNYTTIDNSLSIILTFPVFVWATATYSNIKVLPPQTKLPLLLNELRALYIDGGKFIEILIHMPGFLSDWISYSCKRECEINHRFLNDSEITSRRYPYVIKTN
jgi:hypothetical protein